MALDSSVDDRTRWRPAEGVSWCEPVGATVLLSLKTGRYHTLNVTGGLVWNHIVRGDSIVHIADTLLEELQPQIPLASVRSDVREIVRDLQRAKLIVSEKSARPTDAGIGQRLRRLNRPASEVKRRTSVPRRAPSRVACLADGMRRLVS